MRVLLPRTCKPDRYKIHLTTDLVTFDFEGEQEILIDINSQIKSITLHSLNLHIDVASVSLTTHIRTHNATNVTYDESAQTATLHFDDASVILPAQKASLKMRFAGKLNEGLCGFYRSAYTTESGETRFMAVTQFEPTDARRAFPCWDEPNQKAIFEITLSVPNDRTALSNMNILSETPSPIREGYKVVQYAPTPLMSTYLVAFVIGELDYIEDFTKDGARVVVRVYTQKGKAEKGRFALDVATRTLPYFSEFFGIGYPLPKMDLLAIPDFSAGAMENWGCITYRETRLLIDPQVSSASTMQATARTICHEIAHQWFGNLTTMDWWTHLWLNEGFARFIEHLAVDHLFPEWDIWTQFVYSVVGTAFSLDSLRNSHPIEIEVNDPSEINEIFDAISYAKGGSVIRMLAEYIGAEKFKEGLRIYLSTHKYSNAVTEDLWRALATVAKDSMIDTVMSTWVKQTGYPVVYVNETVINETEVLLHFKQVRFLSSGIDSSDETLWAIPITLKVEGQDAPVNFLMREREASLRVTVPNSSESWIKVNYGQSGFYRVCYSEALLRRLQSAIRSLAISAADRLAILSDLFSLSRAGEIRLGSVFDFIRAYENETDYSVWAELSSRIGGLNVLLNREPFYPAFQQFVISVFHKISERFGWNLNATSHLERLFQSLVISRMALANHQPTIQEAIKRFTQQTTTNNESQPTIPSDLRASVYRMVATNGSESDCDTLFAMYRSSELNEEKLRCLQACCFSRNSQRLRELLEFICFSPEFRAQDITSPLSALSMNPVSSELTWEFFKSEFQRIIGKYSGDFMIVSHIVSAVIGSFTTNERADDVEAFFTANPVPAATRTIKQCLEKIRSNAAYLNRERESLSQWLSSSQQ